MAPEPAGVAVGTARLPPADDDGLAPNPSWPPSMGSAMASASSARTTSVGPLFTRRIVTEAASLRARAAQGTAAMVRPSSG